MGASNIVATCHANECKWNDDMRCMANWIKVIPTGEEADCATFEKRGAM